MHALSFICSIDTTVRSILYLDNDSDCGLWIVIVIVIVDCDSDCDCRIFPASSKVTPPPPFTYPSG